MEYPELTIRPLNSEPERQECARLMSRTEPWVTLGRTFEDSLALFNDSLKESYGAFWEKELEGFLVLDLNGPFKGYIQSICVMEPFRNNGIGHKLIRFAEERIFDFSPNVFICVSDFNPHAQKLYQELGYKIVGELVDYIIPGHSEILMRKTAGPLKGSKKT